MNKAKETKLLTIIFLVTELAIVIASIILTSLNNTIYTPSLLFAGGLITLIYSLTISTKLNKKKGLIIGSLLCGVLFILLNFVFGIYQDISFALMFLSLVCLIPFIYDKNRNFKKGITALIILVVVGSIILILTKSFNLVTFFMFANIATAILLFVTSIINKENSNVLIGLLLLLIANAFLFLNSNDSKLLYDLVIVISLPISYSLLALTNKEQYEK